MACALAACTTARPLAERQTAYTYSAFDFSGDAYRRAKRACDASGGTLRHTGTECGFWLCTSVFACEP